MTAQEFSIRLNQARQLGQDALQALAETQLPLVRALAKRFPTGRFSQEELYQQGVVGLMKALRGFDAARGTAFSTYAAAFILGEMRQLCRQSTLLHIPRREMAQRQCIRQAEEALLQQLGRSPTVQELADALHMDAADMMLHMEEVQMISSDAESPGGTALADLLPDPEDWQRRLELRDILARLPELDRRLILLRHRQGMTQTQAGARLGMTQMQVSRREKIIRDLLRRALAE